NGLGQPHHDGCDQPRDCSGRRVGNAGRQGRTRREPTQHRQEAPGGEEQGVCDVETRYVEAVSEIRHGPEVAAG
ncbi:hypothetical protein DQE80_15510, partial [Enterococcus sp. HPCN18]